MSGLPPRNRYKEEGDARIAKRQQEEARREAQVPKNLLEKLVLGQKMEQAKERAEELKKQRLLEKQEQTKRARIIQASPDDGDDGGDDGDDGDNGDNDNEAGGEVIDDAPAPLRRVVPSRKRKDPPEPPEENDLGLFLDAEDRLRGRKRFQLRQGRHWRVE
jgi:hypothetical protein